MKPSSKNDSNSTRRKLTRVQVGKTRDFKAELIVGDKTYQCQVEDFHFQSIRLYCPDLAGIKDLSNLGALTVKYGRTSIGGCSRPQLIRVIDGSMIVLDLSDPLKDRGVRRKERLEVKPNFKPSILAVDPIRMDTVVNFEVLNFSSDGMLLSSSLSNRHLLKGYKFENARILLPGLDIISASFQVEHVKIHEERMRLGVSFTNIETKALEALAQFAIYGTLPASDGTIEQKYEMIKTGIAPIKTFNSAIRVEVVTRPEDYHHALRVRLQAYQNAEKVDSLATLEDMADEFDLHSIVLVAKADNAVVATVRMVECREEGQTFPLERFFSFDEVDQKANRSRYYEISRLAVEPEFQGTDIIVKFFKEMGRIIGANTGMTAMCMATRSLRKLYTRVGFYETSQEIPHPVLKGEYLAILKADREDFFAGSKMSAHAWEKVVKDVFENLKYADITEFKPNLVKINFMLKVEHLLLSFMKLVPKKKRRRA